MSCACCCVLVCVMCVMLVCVFLVCCLRFVGCGCVLCVDNVVIVVWCGAMLMLLRRVWLLAHCSVVAVSVM